MRTEILLIIARLELRAAWCQLIVEGEEADGRVGLETSEMSLFSLEEEVALVVVASK